MRPQNQNIPNHKNKSLVDLKGERWEEIPYTEGYYLISNFGRVKALERMVVSRTAPNGRWIKTRIMGQIHSKNVNTYKGDHTDELSVSYCFEGKRVTTSVRRLVYAAFIQPITKEQMEGKFVYPIDGNGLNCKVENLKLGTKSELRLKELKNDRYIPPTEIVSKGYYSKWAKRLNRTKRKKVKKFDAIGKFIAIYPSLTSAAKKNGVSVGCVGLCVQKKLKTLKGFVYRYENDDYKGEYKNWNNGYRKIVQYSIAGKKINSFDKIVEASRQTNVPPQTINRNARKITRQAGGFVWRYEGDTYKGEYSKILHKKEFYQLSLTGEKLNSFTSISEAARQTNSSGEGIRLCLHKKIKTSNKFIWVYP